MFCKAFVIVIATLHCSFQLRKKFVLFHFPSRTVCSTLISEFAIKKLLPARLARRATCDLKTLTQRIIPLAPGYRTALLSRPGQHLAFHSSFCHSLSNLSTFWMLCCHCFQAVQCSELLMQQSLGHNRRTLDPLLAKCYFYHSRAYELVDRLKEIRRYSGVKKLHNAGGIKQGFFVSICDPPCMGN